MNGHLDAAIIGKGLRGRLTPSTGQWSACCPAHDDVTPSLTVKDGNAGKVLVRCHAGCSQGAVIAALTSRGLWADTPTPERTNGQAPNGAHRPNGAKAPAQQPLGNAVAHWFYQDADGKQIARVTRFEVAGDIDAETGKQRKTFRQFTPDERGGWKPGLSGLQPPLYRLPELLAAPAGSVVYLTEGEKQADALAAWGLVATTNIGGAGKFREEHVQALAGFCVTILPDNDDTGRKHGAQATELLTGTAHTVRILSLPNLPAKGDVIDWQRGGGTVDELARLTAATFEAPEAAPPPQPASLREPGQPPEQPTSDKPPKAKRRGLNASVLVSRMNNAKAWRDAIRLNELTAAIEVRDPFPPSGDAFDGPFRPLRDPIDTLEAMLWFQANGCASASKGLVFDAITIAAHRNQHHPVRAYLDGLQWDKTERVGRLFQHHFNAVMPDEADQKAYDNHVAYLEHVSNCTLVSAVARVMQPGCKVDHLPILVGMQGANKSKGLRALCPNEAWFTDDLSPELIERGTKESLVGKWLVELAEIPHVRKEAERVKAFFSRQSDRFRRAYDRNTSDWPRQCIFLASSNDLEFVDPTGNRRFWPFNVGPIDVAKIISDRDQLWSEAVWLYRNGYEWWLPPKLELIAATQQAAYVEADLWEEPLEEWSAAHIKANEANPEKQGFTLLEAMQGGLGLGGAASIPKPDQMRATVCLKRLGYRRGPRKRLGDRWVRYWNRLPQHSPE